MTTKTSITPAEKDAHRKVRPLDLDLRSMDAVGNIFRVANNFRVQAERSLLQKHNLSFTGFTTSPVSINTSVNYRLVGVYIGTWLAELIGEKGNVVAVSYTHLTLPTTPYV